MSGLSENFKEQTQCDTTWGVASSSDSLIMALAAPERKGSLEREPEPEQMRQIHHACVFVSLNYILTLYCRNLRGLPPK